MPSSVSADTSSALALHGHFIVLEPLDEILNVLNDELITSHSGSLFMFDERIVSLLMTLRSVKKNSLALILTF